MRALALIALLLATPAYAETAHVESLVVPAGSCVSSPFGPRIIPNHPQAGTFHNGIDLPAAVGSPVRAIAAGKLLRIQNHGPGGIEVMVDHGGFVSLYSHLGTVNVSGSDVAAGQQIGTIGMTGVSFGPHLFFGILRNGRAVDPAPILGTPPCTGTSGPVIRQMTPAEILAMGGKIPPTRIYSPDPPKPVSTPAPVRPRA
jgi:murein DD-endopeptidase MepM/ murein hydrolase activator NlpD